MKLPEIEKGLLEHRMTGQKQIELAKLHCLRSIAVNLELLVGIQAAEFNRGSPAERKDGASEFAHAAIKLAQIHTVGIHNDGPRD